MFAQGIYDAIDLAFNNLIKAVDRQVNSVVGEAILREVVCANSVAPVAGPDHCLALGPLFLLFFLLQVIEKSGLHDAHSFLLVPVLRSFILALGNDSRWDVGYAHS